MGLAASQARLLSITRRISDNELRAQLINNEKMRLATESSKVSENYISALNSTNLMFTNYAANNAMQTIPLSYNALTSYNQYNNQYVLSDVAGAVFLREDEARLYAQSNHNLDDYLALHDIEYTSTYWDVIAEKIQEECEVNPELDYAHEIREAAVVRAWYESIGIDALSSVSGIESLSMFNALYALADKINAAYTIYNENIEGRNLLIKTAVDSMVLQNDFKHYFTVSSSHSDFWLNQTASNGWYNLCNSNSGGFVNNFLTLQPTYNNPQDLDTQAARLWWGDSVNVGDGGFQDIYMALWYYGNNQSIPSEIDVSSLPYPWNTRLAGYEPSSPNYQNINLDTWYGNTSHPTSYYNSNIYEVDHNNGGTIPPAGSGSYVFYTAHVFDNSLPDDDYTGLFINIPSAQGNYITKCLWSHDNITGEEGYDPDVTVETINGNTFFKIECDNGDGSGSATYYVPHPENSAPYNFATTKIIKGDWPYVQQTENEPQATDWMREAMKDYLEEVLKVGERVTDEGSHPTQWERFKDDLQFSDREIEIINTLGAEVAGNELPNLIREFFNMLLGEPNLANDPDSGTTYIPLNNYSDFENAKDMINNIVEQLKELEVDGLSSVCFEQSLLDFYGLNYECLDPETAFTSTELTNADYENILNTITVSSINNDIIGVTPDFDGMLWVQFNNLNYGSLSDIINPFNFYTLNDNRALLHELVYPAAMNFFNKHGMPVYGYMKNGEDATAEAEWYTNLFNKIEASGYKELEYGLASSTDWIRFALENGLGIIEQLNTDEKWNKIMYNSCSDITEETSSQRTTLAEAEYNKAMNQIQAKDQRLDLELKNIDTEHSSLQQEYESIKKAMTENIGRTFKLYT